jgi:hypothetical protein
MDTFGNVAQSTLTASDHGDKPVEYFFYVFDSANKDLGNKGDQEAPLKLDLQCKKEEAPKPKVEEPPPPENILPRFFINIGLGTGAGVARGVADQSYKQSRRAAATPRRTSPARWLAGRPARRPAERGRLPKRPRGPRPGQYAPYSAAELALAYNAETCAASTTPSSRAWPRRRSTSPPSSAFASAARWCMSVFGRLQVVTGSKVYRDDPKLALSDSYANEVLNPSPQGVRTKPGFTGAGGIKIKYFLGKDDSKKFRLFVGGQVGGGFSRLRVPMGFANDRNGNSVPTTRSCPPA